jgi:2,3-diaminopropionate biosynthesis protein SbnA
MIYSSIIECVGRTPLVHLRRLFPTPDLTVIAKLEMLNPGGSVKDRPAKRIIEQGLAEGSIAPDTHLIESSSGNMGIGLAMVATVYGLRFTCVVDPNASRASLSVLRHLGARIDMVEDPDEHGGYLITRIRRVRELLERIPNSLWINQYANDLNWRAHRDATVSEILADLDGPVDCLVAAVSTTGTILGLARGLRAVMPGLRVVAVDAVGSVIFGGRPGPRHLPGIGASRVPELLCRDEIDEVLHVSDAEAAQWCRALARHEGIFAGGSSGSVVAAIARLARTVRRPHRIVTILPDRGDRYLDLVYDDAWVERVARMPSGVTA